MDNLKYCDHIYDETTDGYIQLIKFNMDKTYKIYNTESSALRDVVEEVVGEKDSFIGVNTCYKPVRRVNNIRQFRALYIDLDKLPYYKAETIYSIWIMAHEGKIPFPSMVVDSGRGVHLYWRIENAPYGAIQTWQELEDYLYYQLKDLGADIRATDGVRVLRLPNTINSRNNQECKILVINEDIEYSMYDLREQYLNYKPKAYQLELQQTKDLNKKKKQCVVSRLFNSYTLHTARAEDILTICKLRNYQVTGYRNMIIHCYAYWKGIYIREPEELYKEVIELNNSFADPLRDTEIDAVLRCIPKAIEKFINYEQGIRSGQVKRVTKGMRDKEGYWYKNSTLIERLNITAEEMKHLKTIIDYNEKYRRGGEVKRAKQREKRRNKNGLTSREQQKHDRIKKILEMKSKGLKQTEIANLLGITRQAVSKILKELK